MCKEMIFKRKRSILSRKISLEQLVNDFNLSTICRTGDRFTLQNKDARFIVTKKLVEVLVYDGNNETIIKNIKSYFNKKGKNNEI